MPDNHDPDARPCTLSERYTTAAAWVTLAMLALPFALAVLTT